MKVVTRESYLIALRPELEKDEGRFYLPFTSGYNKKNRKRNRQNFEGTSSGPRLHPESGRMLESPYANQPRIKPGVARRNRRARK